MFGKNGEIYQLEFIFICISKHTDVYVHIHTIYKHTCTYMYISCSCYPEIIQMGHKIHLNMKMTIFLNAACYVSYIILNQLRLYQKKE